MALTQKQRLFVDEYLIDLNATQAAIRAGYSKKTAGQIGDENLKKPQIAESIKEAMDSRNKRVQINADYVLNRLVEIDQLDVLDILDNAGNFKPIMEWPKTWRQTLSGVDLQEIMLGDVETVIRKIKWPDKLRNLELLGKHVAVSAFREQVEVNVTHTLSERMAKARERASNG
ncbi:terminase small subunit [Pseudomonas sp. JAI120]|uniref:terminase small subunit n=1 Tax=Pseudomonas sp. JAI120 TaxID=2723063 RepID=UPI0030D983A0